MLAVVRRNPAFRKLWLAQVVSQAGDWLSRMAVLVLIGELSEGHRLLGMGTLYAGELVIRLLPTTALGWLAGPVADRLPRRSLMVASDLARAALVLGLLFVRRPEHLPLLYALVLLQMGVTIFFESARSASVPNTLPREDLHAAYTLTSVTWSVMLSVGAVAGGLLLPLIGTEGVFVLDAASYVLSALLLRHLALPPVPIHPAPFRLRDALLLRELREAFRHVRAAGAAPAVLAKSFWGGAGGYLVLLSVAGNERFADAAVLGGAATAIALFYGARGLGTALGPILARRFHGSSERALHQQIAAGFVVGALGYALFAPCRALVPALCWVLFAHCGGSTLWVASSTLWQRRVEDRFRGRVFALEFLGMTLAFSLGGVLTGVGYDLSGSLTATALATSALVLASGLAWMRLARGTAFDTEPPPAEQELRPLAPTGEDG